MDDDDRGSAAVSRTHGHPEPGALRRVRGDVIDHLDSDAEVSR
jgi:hypothetical protein